MFTRIALPVVATTLLTGLALQANATPGVTYNDAINAHDADAIRATLTDDATALYLATPGKQFVWSRDDYVPFAAGNRLIFTRARGAGIYALNLLSQIETIRPMLAGIPVSLLRPESSLSNYPAANINSGGILYTPSSRSTAGTATVGPSRRR